MGVLSQTDNVSVGISLQILTVASVLVGIKKTTVNVMICLYLTGGDCGGSDGDPVRNMRACQQPDRLDLMG